MDYDSLCIVCEYCDSLTALMGIHEWARDTRYSPESIRARLQRRRAAKIDINTRPTKRQRHENTADQDEAKAVPDETIDSIQPDWDLDVRREMDPDSDEDYTSWFSFSKAKLFRLWDPLDICYKKLPQFANLLRPYLLQTYGLDDEWWTILSSLGASLSGSFLFHFLHGEPEKAADVDIFMTDKHCEDHRAQMDRWLRLNGYTRKSDSEDDDDTYAGVWRSFKCCRKDPSGAIRVINFVVIRGKDNHTVYNYIVSTFDFDFLKIEYDGNKIFAKDLRAVAYKTSEYFDTEAIRYKSPEYHIRRTKNYQRVLRLSRCMQYINHGCTVTNFKFPSVVNVPITVHPDGIHACHTYPRFKQLLQYITAHNEKPEHRYHKIELRLKLEDLYMDESLPGYAKHADYIAGQLASSNKVVFKRKEPNTQAAHTAQVTPEDPITTDEPLFDV
jgi:hypothetical protein